MAGAIKKAVAKVTKKKEVVADKAFQQKGFTKPKGFKGGRG